MLTACLVAGLMTFVLMYFLRDMDGPLDLFQHIRYWLKADVKMPRVNTLLGGVDYEPVQGNGFFGKLFACPWCLSTWIAMVVAAYAVFITNLAWYVWFGVWLAAIAICGTIYRFVVGGE